MKSKRYAPSRFRPAFGMAAFALAATTMTLLVVVPAALSPEYPAASALNARGTAPAAIEVTIVPERIDVVGIRDESLAATPAQNAPATPDRRS